MPYTGTKAQTGLGSTISIGATPTVVGEVNSIKLSGRKWDTEDCTNMQSVNKEFIATISDLGEFAIESKRVSSDAGQLLVEAAFASGASTAFTLQLPKTATQTTTGDKYTWNGIVTEADMTFESTKADTYSFKVKVSGPITFTAGS